MLKFNISTSDSTQMGGKVLSLICFLRPTVLAFGVGLLLMACADTETDKRFITYNGPVEEADSIQVVHSENGLLKIRLHTAKQIKYANEDKIFPKKVFVDFYDPNKQIITTLEADSGRHDFAKNIYIVKGNVVVQKKQTQERLLTDELIWNPTTKKVYSDKKCTIDRLLSGERFEGLGMNAEQDFSNMSIRRPTGYFNTPAGLRAF